MSEVTRRTRRSQAKPYMTKDGSIIRELMHPAVHGNRNQSLAEAEVPAGGTTVPHRHHQSEELYHVIAGHGIVHLGEDVFEVAPGDTIHISPGTPHWIEARGEEALRVLCCCAPPYRHDDTELLEPDEPPPGQRKAVATNPRELDLRMHSQHPLRED